jgi:peptidoglycan L-alanyl-D-glutamate endopeptidase CwlK
MTHDIRHDERLQTVSPRLADVVRKAATYLDFDLLVVEGARTLERQKMLVAKGASRTLKSKHLPGPDGYSRAVDLAPVVDGELRWDWPLFLVINKAMQRASDELGVVLTWGGDWRKFRDGPHWELA